MDIIKTCRHGSTQPHEYILRSCETLKIKCFNCISYIQTKPDDMIVCHKCMGAGWYLQTCPHGSLCNQTISFYCSGP
jgi:hypothetical protein